MSRAIDQWGMGIAFVCLFLPDLIGRRALLLGGSCLMFGGLIVVAAVGGTVARPTGALANLVIVSLTNTHSIPLHAINIAE
jgi:hypothetical protein